jgi:hypothetical protein
MSAVQYNPECENHNDLEIELVFNINIEDIDLIIVSHMRQAAAEVQLANAVQIDTEVQLANAVQIDAEVQLANVQLANVQVANVQVAGIYEFHILLTLSNITIHTFIKTQDRQFAIEFIVYNNRSPFVRCDGNPICCMTVEMDILINSINSVNFIHMPCIQKKIISNVETEMLTKFMQFCSNFAAVLYNIDNIYETITDNNKIHEIFADVFDF